MGKYLLPVAGQQLKATITRIERKKAADVFTERKTGKYKGQYRGPDEPVFCIYGRLDGDPDKKEFRLGTFNAPKTARTFGTSKLVKFVRATLGDVAEVSDDLHELIGRTVTGASDAKGFFRLG
jgi:hypothetical protein